MASEWVKMVTYDDNSRPFKVRIQVNEMLPEPLYNFSLAQFIGLDLYLQLSRYDDSNHRHPSPHCGMIQLSGKRFYFFPPPCNRNNHPRAANQRAYWDWRKKQDRVEEDGEAMVYGYGSRICKYGREKQISRFAGARKKY